jgi:hypothetical protein
MRDLVVVLIVGAMIGWFLGFSASRGKAEVQLDNARMQRTTAATQREVQFAIDFERIASAFERIADKLEE